MIKAADLPETYYFFKLSSKKRLQQIQQGKIFMKNLKYFINLENQTGVKGKGDAFEASQINIKKHALIINGKKVDNIGPPPGVIRDTYDLKRPVFCIMCKNIYSNCIRDEYPFFEFKVSFNPKVLEDFGDDDKPCVLIIHDTQKFLERFERALKKDNIGFDRGFVKYRNKTIPQICNGGILMDNAFTKDEYFAHQEEFRFLLHTQIDDNVVVDIGNIEDISVITDSRIIESGFHLSMEIEI